jgi:hypothetical protein
MVMNAIGTRPRLRRSVLGPAVVLWSVLGVLLLCFATIAYADPPTTTPRDLSGWQTSSFTVYLDCLAGEASGDELYATCYRMDWETAFNEKLWSSGHTSGTLWVWYYFLSRPHEGIRQFSYYSRGYNAQAGTYETEPTKSMTVKIDTSSPTADVLEAPDGWVRAARTLEFTASDSASGVKTFNLNADAAANTWTYGEGTASVAQSWTVAAPGDHSNDGMHTFEYWATDWVDHESVHGEYSGSFAFGVDTRRPRVQAPSAASVRRYRTATLKCRVYDAAPSAGTADVTVRIKTLRGKTVKTLRLYDQKVGKLLKCRFSCLLGKGTYRFYVSATDPAGNPQEKVRSNILRVR